jgi:[ribosomal protein S18]-alanine N-acetyltransferase
MTNISMGTVADIGSIMPVMASAFDPTFGEAWSADQVRGALSMPGCSLLIMRGDAGIEGFALIRIILDEAELLLIAVDRAAQQQGRGKSLFHQTADFAKEERVKRLHVEVREDNPATKFYVDLGFVKVGERPNYYRRSDGGPTKAITFVYGIS